MNFTGFCSYPLGGSTTGTLILSTSAAFAATMYATISCRFVVVTFTSDSGGFEDAFHVGSHNQGDVSGSLSTWAAEAGNTDVATYKAAVGLYQWLRPTDAYNWSQGSCFGYQESMLASITDSYFDASRSFAVFAVLLAIFQALWMFLTACLSMNRIQCALFVVLSFVGTVSTGLTFLFTKSALCQSAFQTQDCAIDEGGLVMMTACVLWLITFSIAVCFVVPTVISSTSAVDVARQDARAKATATRTPQKSRDKASTFRADTHASIPKIKASRTATTTQPSVHQSYSYDSESSWTQRIPKRSETHDLTERDVSGPLSGSRGRGFAIPSRSSANRDSSANARDSSTHDIHTYITKRLDRIEELADV